MNEPIHQEHSAAWRLQTIISFGLSFGGVLLGIVYLPAEPWVKAFLALGVCYAITSAISLSKTMRDEHEAKKFVHRVDTAKIEQFLAQQDPMRVP